MDEHGPGSPHNATEAGLLHPGTMVDHYRVVRLVGRGGFGEVYLARDTKLGRKAALKILSAMHFASPEASEQFLFEARATARFSHPNIVAIYGVGELEGSPYVALEYLEGQTLARRIRDESLSIRETMRIALDIADALAEAHARGILHCDLKPENVLIPPDGRVRLFDFGLAEPVQVKEGPVHGEGGLKGVDSWEELIADSEMATAKTLSGDEDIRGTPYYMAPEQWRQEERTDATDIWALGVILYELVTGSRPFSAPTLVGMAYQVSGDKPVPQLSESEDLPDDLRTLIHDCLRKVPSQRPSAQKVVQRLEKMIYRRRHSDVPGRSPFPGLMPFSERYADFFFGRSAEVAAFLERIRHDPVLPVVGPSGAGKSSFIEAGVIPRLKERGRWITLRLRPGNRPFDNLAARLTGQMDQPQLDAGELAHRLLQSPPLLGMMLSDLAEQNGCRVLLFVDQMEELYSQVVAPRQRRRFMRAICGAADDPEEPVRVVFTLRDDFLGRLAEGAMVRQALSRVTVMRSPGTEALREILTRPPEMMGYRYDDPKLIDEMLSAVEGEHACLPLLQFATRMLWECRDEQQRLLCRASYDRLGGVAGALAEHADGVLEGLSPSQVALTRDLLLRLVTAEGTRRVMPRIEALSGLGTEAEEILDRLIQARLVLVGKGRDDEEVEAELELVHESLVYRWRRLARWFDEDREDLALLGDLERAAELWDKRGCPTDEVWQGKALADAEAIVFKRPTPPPERVTRFLQVGRQRQQRMRARRRVIRTAGAALLVLITCIALAVAWILAEKEREATRQKELAQAERGRARRRASEAQREAARAALLRESMLEARAKLRGSLELQDSTIARALWSRLRRTPLVWRKELGAAVYDVAFSPDGRTLAAACQDRTITLVDVQTLAVRYLRGHRDQVFSVAFSPDGKRLASGTWSGQVGLWDLATGRLQTLSGHRGKVCRVAFSPDGKALVSGGYDKTVRIWDVEKGKLQRVCQGHGGRVFDVAFSHDGRRLASASWDRSVRIWDVATCNADLVLEGHTDRVLSVAYSPDGRQLASGGWDRTVRLWNARSGQQQAVLTGHQATVYGVAYAARGQVLASASYDRTLRIWDVPAEKSRHVLRGHGAWVHRVAFNATSGLLASSSADHSVRLWDIRHAGEQKEPVGHRDRIFGAAISPDGRWLATAGMDKAIRLWSLDRGIQQKVLGGHEACVFSVAFGPDGQQLASGSWDKTIRLWNVNEGTQTRVLRGHTAEVSAVLYQPKRQRLASGSWDRTLRIWDIASGRQIRVLSGHEGAIYDLALSPDGRRLASASADGTIRLWDAASGRELEVLGGHGGPVYGVAFGPRGQRLTAADGGGGVWLWDLASMQSRLLGRHAKRAYHLAFHPDGRWIGSPSADGTARLWEVGTASEGATKVLSGHDSEVNFLRFSPDGALTVTTSDDGVVRVWRTESGLPHWRAPLMFHDPPRLLTHRGIVALESGEVSPLPPSSNRNRRIADGEVIQGTIGTDGTMLALVSARGSVEVWDQRTDRRVWQTKLGTAQIKDLHLFADGGAALLHGGAALVLDATGAPKELTRKATALTVSGQRILVASGGQVLVFDKSGTSGFRLSTGLDVTAMVQTRRWLATGHRDGNIELVPVGGADARPSFAFEQVPSSTVVRMVPGPRDTIVIGYANGLVGIWSLTSGQRLAHDHLHGPVVHLALEEQKLFAATSMGDYAIIDLQPFFQPYCDLLRQVWDHVPVVLEGSLPVLRQPPKSHRCADASGR